MIVRDHKSLNAPTVSRRITSIHLTTVVKTQHYVDNVGDLPLTTGIQKPWLLMQMATDAPSLNVKSMILKTIMMPIKNSSVLDVVVIISMINVISFDLLFSLRKGITASLVDPSPP